MSKKLLQAAAGAAGEALYVEDVFSTYLYTGNGSTQTITNGIDLSGEGGLVWLKNRTSAISHLLTSTITINGGLRSNSTAAQFVDSNYNFSYSATGFSQNNSFTDTNSSGDTYASWTFRKAEKFFTVVTYTGDGNASQTINHDLGSTPGCIIVKNLSQADAWYVYHRSNTASPETDYLVLNTNAGTVDSAGAWNDTAPTSTQFTVGTDDNVNASGESYVAYLFAHDAGGFGDGGSESIIKCGSYTGNGSTDGPTVTLGFEPQWLMIRGTGGGDWQILDNMRGIHSGGTNDARLLANSSAAEYNSLEAVQLQATGFKIDGTTGGAFNGSGSNYIYMAIRRPMKTPESGAEVFAPISHTGTGAATSITGIGFPPDMAISVNYPKDWDSANVVFDRLRGQSGSTRLEANGAGPEQAASGGWGDWYDDVAKITGSYSGINGSARNYINYFFKRATGFFDVVCYEGTGSAHAETHNLGVVPELIIVKNRDVTDAWAVYVGDETDYLVLNTTAATADDSTYWNDTAPTSTQFTVGTQAVVNTSSESYVAYLFATLAGISKVGSYTGTAANLDVDCGFSAGARFILIKRTDSTGDWYVWDSERGIVAGDDPYLLLNSTAAEVTNTDYIDPLASGFTVTSSATAALNASGGTYIYLAIA